MSERQATAVFDAFCAGVLLVFFAFVMAGCATAPPLTPGGGQSEGAAHLRAWGTESEVEWANTAPTEAEIQNKSIRGERNKRDLVEERGQSAEAERANSDAKAVASVETITMQQEALGDCIQRSIRDNLSVCPCWLNFSEDWKAEDDLYQSNCPVAPPVADTPAPAPRGSGKPIDDAAETLEQRLRREEGYSGAPYRDHKGNCTIGYGHLIEDATCSEFEARGVLREDMSKAERNARLVVGEVVWRTLSKGRREALIEMAFTHGRDGLRGYGDMLRWIQIRRWNDAALAVKDSDWCRDPATAQRCGSVAERIRSGK